MSSRLKKGFSAVLAVVTVVSSGQITPCIAAAADAVEAAVSKITGGDVNGDGKTDSADVDALYAFIGKSAGAAEKNSKYDFYKDSAVDVRDLLAVKQLADGKAPVKPEKEASGDTVRIEVGNAECVPGEKVSIDVNIIDWDQDLGAVELYLDFDSNLTLADVSCTGKYQYVSDGNEIKLFGITDLVDVYRGTVATLTFNVPDTAYGDYDVKIKNCAVYNNEFQSLKATTQVGLIAADVTERPLYLSPAYVNSKSMRLTWSMPYCSGDLEGYIVYRDGKEITRVKGTEFYDQKLETDKKYVYEVQAYGADGYLSAKSKAITAVPKAPVISALGLTDNADRVGGKKTDIRASMENTVDAAAYSLSYTDKTGKTETIYSAENTAVSTADIRWNIKDLPSGEYTLKFSVTDKDGASAEKTISVTLDTDPPEQVFGFDIFEGEKETKLTWGIAAEAKVVGYNIYRRTEKGTYKLLKYIDSRETLEYSDKDLKEGDIYFYMMCAVDKYGQEGIYSDEKSAAAKGDETAPEMTLFLPENGKVLSHYVTISLKADDNIGVSSVAAFISADDGKTWDKLFEGKGASCSYSFDTTEYEEANIKLKAMAYDYAGNESKDLVHIYAIDNKGPDQVVNLRAISVTDVIATIAWEDVADKDFSHFIARYYPTEDPENITDVNISRSLGTNIYGLSPDTSYTIEVAAVDIYDNIGKFSDPLSFVTIADKVAPVIDSFSPEPGYFNKAINVSAHARDDYSVASVSIQASQSNEKDAVWTDAAVIKNENGGIGFYAEHSLDLTNYEEGKLYLRAFAKDAAGNVGEKSAIREYIVDKTAPEAPTKFSASSAADTIELTWESYENNVDSALFSLYRSDKEDGEYSVILDKSNSLNYFDRSAEPGKTYYYKLTAIDAAGNESKMSKAVSAMLKEDKEKPEIVSVSPAETDILSTAFNKISVLASDNVKLASVTMEYRLTADGTFKSFAEIKNINDYYTVAEGTLPAEALKNNGTVEVRITAVDTANLKSEAKTVKYTVDNSSTKIKEIKAEQLTDHISLTWTAEENKLSVGYYIYKKANTGSWQRIGSIAVDPEKKGSYEFTDYSKNAAGTLLYKVEAYCTNGIMTVKETDPMQIYTTPEAYLSVENAQQKDVEYIFDATGCRDYYGIESIVLDYGDGTKVSDTNAATAKFIHKYNKTGTFTAKLTVTNEQGLVTVIEQQIEVIERILLGESTVYVKTTEGKNASGISVYVDLGTERQKKLTTDASGKVTFTSVAGLHTIGVYGDGYLPDEKECTILAGKGNKFNFTVTEKDIVTADFKVQRMKLDEIKAAGIDISSPENQHILEVEVNLAYKTHEHDKGRMTFLTNGKGAIFNFGWSGGWGDGIWGGGDGKDTVTKPVYVNVNPETNEVDTLITMTVPIKASFLKEFFHASMTVYNNADEQYTISQNQVTLNLPEGLTLIDTDTSDPQEVDLGIIEGQSSKDINWIIRGDVDGTYNISASYSGFLDRFNEQISAEFSPDEPIIVYGEKAVQVDIIVPEQMFDNRFVFEVRMTNNSPVDVYCPNTDVGKIVSSAFGVSDYGYAFIRQRSIKKDGRYVRIIPADDPPLEILEPGFTYSVIYTCSDIFNWDALDENNATGEDSFYDSRLDVVKASLEVMNDSRIPVTLSVVPNQEFIIVDEIKELDYDSSKEFVLFITGGKYEKPLKNATVEFNGEKKTTGDDGYVILQIPTDGKNHFMDVHCGGYKRKEILPYIGYTAGIDYVQLESTGMYEEEESEEEQHYEPGHTSTGFVDAAGNLATPGAFGNPEEDTPPIIQRYAGNMTIGKSFEYEINEDIPILGGHKFNFDNINLPLTFSLDDKGFASILFLNKSFDLKTFMDDDPDNDGDEPEEDSLQDEFKAACKVIDQFKGKTMRQIKGDLKNAAIKKQPVKLGGEMKLLDMDNVDFNLSFVGALSASYDPKKGFAECVRTGGVVFRGQILVQFEFKYGFETNVVVGSIPLVIGVGVGLKLNSDSSFTIECNNGDIEFTGSVALDAELEGEVFFGVGVAEMVGAGVYGEIHPHAYFTLISMVPEDVGLDKVTLEYEIGFRVYLGPFELKKEMSYLSTDDPIVLYSKRAKQQSLPNREFNLNHYLAAIMNESLYTLDTRTYESKWTGGEGTVTSANGYLPLSIIASDTIDTTSVQLASVGGHLVMAYLDSDSTRAAANSYKLMYSVYDAKTGWSKPVQLDSDKTCDYAPYMWSDGSQLYLIYQNAAEGLGEKSELTDWTAAQNIAVSSFDAKTLKFNAPTAITADSDTYDKNPVIASSNGKTYAAWVSNSDTSYFGTNSTNNIMISVLGENGWSAPETVVSKSKTVTDMLIADHNDEPYIVYITDDNNDLATSDDRSLLTLKYGDDQPCLISSGAVSSIVYDKTGADKQKCLYWQENSNIKRSEDFTSSAYLFDEGIAALTSGFNIAGDRIIWNASESSTVSNLWCSEFDSKSGKWSNASKLTDQDQFLENPSSAVLGDEIITVMNRRKVDFSGDEVNTTNAIVSLNIKSITNIALTDVYCDNDNYAKNKTIPVSLTVENRGDKPVNGVHVKAVGDDGSVLLDKVYKETVIPANGIDFIDDVLKPDPAKTKTIKITVNTADDKDSFADDSSFEISTAFSLIDVTAKKTDKSTLTLTATNNGTAAGSDEITIAELGTGKVIDTVTVKDVPAGKSVTQTIDLSKYSGITAEGITVKGSDMAAERVLFNALKDVVAQEAPEYTLGDVNNDGFIDSSDATKVLQEYSALSTGNKSTLTDIQKKAADVNHDGQIDATDATDILKFYAALSTGEHPSFE